jgi:hypothetical protein
MFTNIELEYLERKHKQHFKHLTWIEFIQHEKLVLILVALRELKQEFNIPSDNFHLEDAFKFTEDLREKYLRRE